MRQGLIKQSRTKRQLREDYPPSAVLLTVNSDRSDTGLLPTFKAGLSGGLTATTQPGHFWQCSSRDLAHIVPARWISQGV
jgi:hypothetical protein